MSDKIFELNEASRRLKDMLAALDRSHREAAAPIVRRLADIESLRHPEPALWSLGQVVLDDPRERAHKQLADALAGSLDRIIGDAITTRLGSGWTHDDLRGRLARYEHGDGRADWALDGKPLLTTWPTEMQVTGSRIEVTQRYEVKP